MSPGVEMHVNYQGTRVTFTQRRHTTTLPRNAVVAAMKDIERDHMDALRRNGLELDWQTLKDALVRMDMAAEKLADHLIDVSMGQQ